MHTDWVELLERRNNNETKTDNIIEINNSNIEVNNSQIKVNNSQIEVNNSEYRLLELKLKMQNIK
jgi:DNA-binding response OmpR family regulator